MFYQTVIHITFLLSAMAIAAVDRKLPAASGKGASKLPRDAPPGLRDQH